MSTDDDGWEPELSLGDEQVADLHLQGKTVKEIAGQLDLDHNTVRRRLNKPATRAWITRQRAELLIPLQNLIHSELVNSLKVITSIRDNALAADRDRLAAAGKILDLAFKVDEVVNVKATLAYLESVVPPELVEGSPNARRY